MGIGQYWTVRMSQIKMLSWSCFCLFLFIRFMPNLIYQRGYIIWYGYFVLTVKAWTEDHFQVRQQKILKHGSHFESTYRVEMFDFIISVGSGLHNNETTDKLQLVYWASTCNTALVCPLLVGVAIQVKNTNVCTHRKSEYYTYMQYTV